jgi:antirestriction protein ArdC
MGQDAVSLRDQLEVFRAGLTDEQVAAVAARFPDYSERNALLVVMQRPDASRVRGFRAWLAEGRVVRKGERSLKILAPAGDGTHKADRVELDDGAEEARRKRFFRLASVFDVTQTDPLPDREAGDRDAALNGQGVAHDEEQRRERTTA